MMSSLRYPIGTYKYYIEGLNIDKRNLEDTMAKLSKFSDTTPELYRQNFESERIDELWRIYHRGKKRIEETEEWLKKNVSANSQEILDDITFLTELLKYSS